MDPVIAVPRTTKATFRRSVFLAAGVGVAAVIVSLPLGYLGFALFGLVGLALGALNTALVQRSVVQFTAAGAHDKGRFARSVLGRLGVVTVLAVAVALIVRPAGLGVFLGLAAFQLLSIGAASVPALKELRRKEARQP